MVSGRWGARIRATMEGLVWILLGAVVDRLTGGIDCRLRWVDQQGWGQGDDWQSDGQASYRDGGKTDDGSG